MFSDKLQTVTGVLTIFPGFCVAPAPAVVVVDEIPNLKAQGYIDQLSFINFCVWCWSRIQYYIIAVVKRPHFRLYN